METTTPYRAVALLILGSLAPLSAQNFNEASRSSITHPLAIDDLEGREPKRFDEVSVPGTYEVPATKTPANLSHDTVVFLSQDAATLGNRVGSNRSVESVVDLAPLRDPSPFRKVAVNAGTSSSEVIAKGLPMGLALLSATYRNPGEAVDEKDCGALGLSIQQRVKLDPSKILEIVASEITANAACACEVVKAALTAAGANAELTAQVVEVAATSAPESMRIISQCAIAAVPESLEGVQAVLAKLDPNSGESGYSSKGAKSAKSSKAKAVIPPKIDKGNPLDLPPLGPPLPPPPVNPPPVTDVDSYIKVAR